jgi:hypothetical protein
LERPPSGILHASKRERSKSRSFASKRERREGKERGEKKKEEKVEDPQCKRIRPTAGLDLAGH